MATDEASAARRARLVPIVVALLSVTACAAERESTPPSLVPLVPPAEVPVSTVAPTTTAAPSSDPNNPLVTAVPDMDCAYAERPPAGEITFVVGDRLYGAAPDGSGLRCLTTLTGEQLGPVEWSPDGERALLDSAWVFDAKGIRLSGFDAANLRVNWEWPTSTGIFAPSESGGSLVRRDAADPNLRTEITFLAETVAAVAHPSGGAVIASGVAPDGTSGLYVADSNGQNPRMLASVSSTDPATTITITEVVVDAAGDVVYFMVDKSTSFRVEQLSLTDLSIIELSHEQAPIADLTTGPTRRTIAWKVGLCNSVTRARVRDERTGTPVDVGTGTPIESLSLAPIGWLDGARLVVEARPLGCDGPADVWIWNLFDGSATLLAKTVDFPSVRTTPSAASPLSIDAGAVPGTLP
ncbi:MAG: hypothetical protein AB7L17_08485 [Ilumatobacteraceae bacterium]